jgi:hypothetical protein
VGNVTPLGIQEVAAAARLGSPHPAAMADPWEGTEVMGSLTLDLEEARAVLVLRGLVAGEAVVRERAVLRPQVMRERLAWSCLRVWRRKDLEALLKFDLREVATDPMAGRGVAVVAQVATTLAHQAETAAMEG